MSKADNFFDPQSILFRSGIVLVMGALLIIPCSSALAGPPMAVDGFWNDEKIEYLGAKNVKGAESEVAPASPGHAEPESNDAKYELKDMRVCQVDLNNIDVNCEMEKSTCTGGENGTLVEIYSRRTDVADAEWKSTAEFACRYPSQRDGESEGFPGFSLSDFRSLSIQSAKSVVEPSPHTLRGAHTNFYAVAEEQRFEIDVAGYSVEVLARPVAFAWDYGDGTSFGPVASPGSALPQDRWGEETVTSHVFEATGDFDVRLTTYFIGEYSVDGGPRIAIPGQAAVESAPVTISVWRSETNNYADNCFENPQGAGCQGADG